MLSTAVRSVSSSPWRSRRHFNSVMTGYDRIEKTYVRRRKTAESPPGSELAMASLSHPTSPPSDKLKTCADCRTSMTPLWRRGPDGPKSLCNACGIRYRRKKPMGNEGSGSKLKAMKSSKNGAKEGKEGMVVLLMQHRSKEENGGGDYGRQEAEAALLLMALSSGLFVPS